MKRTWLIIGVVVGFVICAGVLVVKSSKQKKGEATTSPQSVPKSYYSPIELLGFSETQLPEIIIEIENKRFPVTLDLGSNGALGLSKKCMAEIEEKKLLCSEMKCGFRGNVYSENIFEVPKLKMGDVQFSSLRLCEEADEMQKETSLVVGDEIPIKKTVGHVGWLLFQCMNLFLDLGHKNVGFCDSFQTLVGLGCNEETFVKIPLMIERGFVEISVETDRGPLRCLLDTGATMNFIKIENSEGLSPEEIAGNVANKTEFQVFQIGGMNFGKQEFRHLPINAPIPVEAILGMEFFMKHRVFIDFQEGWVYIAFANER